VTARLATALLLVPALLVAPVACADDGPYRSCAAAWDADDAPLTPGDPGYSSWLDRADRVADGVACADDPRAAS
jgi:hypothetical protein